MQAGMMLTQHTEVAARWDDLYARDADTDPAFVALANNQGRPVGAGFNVYLNGHYFTIQTDYFYVFGRRTGDDAHVARLQLDATF